MQLGSAKVTFPFGIPTTKAIDGPEIDAKGNEIFVHFITAVHFSSL
jgi:hypothetical protein